MPLCDASGAACLIPPPLPVAFRSCARCWCRLNLSADGVMCCVLTCRRSARCASCVFFWCACASLCGGFSRVRLQWTRCTSDGVRQFGKSDNRN